MRTNRADGAAASSMGAMVSAFEWSQTPLGSRETWPQSLNMASDMVLACHFPMVLLWGPALIQIYNDGYRVIMGRKHPTGLGQATRECWPEVWNVNEPIYTRVWQGETLTFEDQLYPITRHGFLEQAYFTLCYSPVRDERGQVGGVLVTVFETTERLNAERALRISEERLRQVFTQAPVGVCVLRGRDLVYELVNSSYKEFLPDRVLLGRPLLEAIPELDPKILGIIKDVFDTGEPFVAHEFLIPLDRDRDGVAEDAWFTFVYQPLREDDGAVSGIVAIAVDVTAQVRARQELELANHSLEEFAHVASHDLQEPLRMVTAYSQLLARCLAEVATGEQLQFLNFIQHGAKRMENLIRDLLSYSRSVHTAADVVRGEADLEVALDEALAAVGDHREENGASITRDPLPIVLGDTTQFVHVFQNLLSNALKYRSATPHIHIGAKLQDGYCVVSVNDNGIGFQQDQAERIFGLFKRLHRDDEYPGTGLGLAICRRIIERYGGRIWAESDLGAGSTFFFSVPAAHV